MESIIFSLHFVLYFILILSPFIEDCGIKLNSFIIITFITLHFITKYGKCGIINFERFFLKENFKNGFFYKLIKPVISHKNNIFYDKFFYLHFIYIFILFIQIYQNNCVGIFYNELMKVIKR